MASTNAVRHAFDVIESSIPPTLPHLIALVGDDRFLKRLVLDRLLGAGTDAEFDEYTGDEHAWSDIYDDLVTVSLFGSGPRRVLVNEADRLVTQYRGELERYVERPRGSGTLVLELQSLPSNTNLYRAIARHGWLIECRQPETKRGRSKSPDVGRMQKWLVGWGETRHGIKLTREAVELLSELIGWKFGLLDQELAKLALFVESQGRVNIELVHQVVGGWRTQTTWNMLDAVADGDATSALRQLDQLLQAGESPQALFGSMAWSLRRFAAATRTIEQQEYRGMRVSLPAALDQVGFRKWPANALERAGVQLKQISRQRGGQLYGWLLETDLALKGTHSAPHRARWALEQLILRLSRQCRPALLPTRAQRRQ